MRLLDRVWKTSACALLAVATCLVPRGATAVESGMSRRVECRDERVRFMGNWRTVVAADKELGPYAERSDSKGASVELDFCGTTVGLAHQAGGLGWEWGVIFPDTGRALGLTEVRIDGRPAAPIHGAVTVDAEGRAVVDTSRGGRTLLARGLPAGRHRVTVTNLGAPGQPDGSTAVVVKGFWTDAEGEATACAAWRAADSVRGGEGWRARAAELAASAKASEDLARLNALVAASREMDALAAKLRGVAAEPPDVPMVAAERRYWTPNAETQAYLRRLSELRAHVGALLAQADAFRYDASGVAAFDALMAGLHRGADEVDAFFRGEVARLSPIVFYTGSPLRSGAAPNHIWQSQPHDGKWGCSIRVWDPGHSERPAKVLYEDANALIYDLSLAYDAKTVLFSVRRNREQCWHICEIGADGRGFKQITDGPNHDVSPVPLPDGRIAFISSRTRGSHTVCQSGPSTHVYVMNRDGSDAHDLSANTLSDFGLSILDDGRLLFTRWEYVDVNLTYRQSLWTQRPDGCQFQLWFGNTIIDPATFWQAREVPGRYAAVCTFTSHHHTPRGAIGLVTNRSGPEAPSGTGFRWLTREFPAIGDRDNFWAYCDPFPVGDSRFLVSYGGGGLGRFRLFLLDDRGNQVPVYDDPATSCFGPQPLAPRPVPAKLTDAVPKEVAAIRVPAAPPGQPVATNVPLARLMVSDVYRGLSPPVPRGVVKSVRIMEQLPKTVDRTWNFVLDQGPLMGASSYYAKRVWGYAPVEADGSAFFEVPAQKEVYLQLCDAEGREVQRMTSAVPLMPGETQSCAGCHESRQAATPSADRPLAARRAPTVLALPPWGNAGVLDYCRVVQPVLDRHCVRCHQGANPPRGVSLTGDYTRFFNMSYDSLVIRAHAEEVSRARYTGRGSAKPMVQCLHLLHGVMLPFRAQDSGARASRLPEFFRPEHCKTNVPPGDLRIVYEWIDAMIPYYPTTDFAHREAKSNRDKWADKDRRTLLPWFTEGFAPIYNRRCASCHGEAKGELGLAEPRQWAWIDLTRPEWSPALAAHLAKASGGRGIEAKDFAFRDTSDPDYQALLKAIEEGGRRAAETPEADMPGFVSRSEDRAFQYR